MQHITHFAIHLQGVAVAHIFIFQFEFYALGQMPDIFCCPSNEIIHRQHVPAFDDEPAAHVKETENKGDQEQQAQATGTAGIPARRYIRRRKTITKSHESGRIVSCDGEVVNRRSAGYTGELRFLEEECVR